jgi:outer membrane protein
MMKKTLLILSSMAFLGTGWSAIKVGVVDLEKALQGVKKGREAKARLEKKFKEKKDKFEKQKKDFETAQEEFKKKSVVLSEKAKGEQVMALQQKYAELQQSNQAAQVEMQQEELKETQPILKGLAEMMGDIGKEAGVEMVFESKAGLLFAADKIDLTDKLVSKYDSKNK